MSTKAILAKLHSKKSAIIAGIPQTFTAAMSFESIVQGVGLACARNERLASCKPDNVYLCVLDVVRLGLDLSPLMQHAFLVPFWSKDANSFECTVMIGQQGKIELAFRTGLYASIVTETCHLNDDFEFDLARRHLRHSYDPKIADRGRMLFAYARAWLNGFDLNGPPNFQEIMSAHDFDKIEAASKKRSKGKLSPAYKAWRNEMARRSVLARMLKRSPKSRDLTAVLTREAEIAVRVNRGDVIEADFVHADPSMEPKKIAEAPPDYEQEARELEAEREQIAALPPARREGDDDADGDMP